jgi:hypothetical protein
MRSDELDKILDNALWCYSREAPRPGLEHRILNRVRARRERRRLTWLRWVVAIPAFSCVLFFALMFLRTRDSVPKSWKPAAIISSAAPLPRIAAGAVQTTVVKRRPKHVGLPKREQFPTPAPLTAEERALLAFAVRSPKQAEKLFADAHTHTTEPLQIKEIQIEPLQGSGE